jgi:hypothetical protein
VENSVFYLYTVMGTFGGLASAIFASQAAQDTNFSSISSIGYVLPSYQNQFIGVGLSLGIGLVSGLIMAPLICFMNI